MPLRLVADDDSPPGLGIAWTEPAPGGRVVVAARGELDTATEPSLSRALADASLRSDHLLVDLRRVTFMDASSLRAVLRARRTVTDRGGSLELVAASRCVRRLLELTGAEAELGGGLLVRPR